MTDISIVVSTARREFSIVGREDENWFSLLFESIERQTFDGSVEVVIVDNLYADRELPDTSLDVKHIPTEPNVWEPLYLPNIARGFNIGIREAKGEVILILGDCEELYGREELDLGWKYYKGGYVLFLMCEYWEGKRRKKGGEHFGYLQMLKENKAVVPQEGVDSQISFVPREAFKKLQGFDERFDGSKCLEDTDANERLGRSGYKGVFDMRAREIKHEHYPVVFHGREIARNNGFVYQYFDKYESGRIVANQPIRYPDKFTEMLTKGTLNNLNLTKEQKDRELRLMPLCVEYKNAIVIK